MGQVACIVICDSFKRIWTNHLPIHCLQDRITSSMMDSYFIVYWTFRVHFLFCLPSPFSKKWSCILVLLLLKYIIFLLFAFLHPFYSGFHWHDHFDKHYFDIRLRLFVTQRLILKILRFHHAICLYLITSYLYRYLVKYLQLWHVYWNISLELQAYSHNCQKRTSIIDRTTRNSLSVFESPSRYRCFSNFVSFNAIIECSF